MSQSFCRNLRIKFILAGFLLLCALVGLLAANNVSRAITLSDHNYIGKIVELGGYEWASLQNPQDFDSEIKTIRAVQDAILDKTPEQERIALGTPREPEDLYKLNHALCGDRSRFLDKALRMAGLESRFAYIYDTSAVRSPFWALLSTDRSKVTSHAAVEVKTEKGWMVVDSVSRWIALDDQGDVYSLEQIQNAPDGKTIAWEGGSMHPLLQGRFAYLYGLYSRHGRFYPPYTPIPDINWPEFMWNL